MVVALRGVALVCLMSLSSAGAEEVTLQFGDLCITARRSTASGAESAATASEEGAAEANQRPQAARAQRGAAATKAKAKASRRSPVRGGSRYYVITRARSRNSDLLGIHFAPWSHVASLLPGGALFGSGVTLRGFDDLDEATDFWVEAGWALPAPLLEA